VIEKEAVDGAITAGYEGFRETTDIETLDALLAIVAASKELDARVGMVGVELSDLVMSATANLYRSKRILPAGKGTCQGSTRTCIEACGRPLGLKSVNTIKLTINSYNAHHSSVSPLIGASAPLP
jgi:hypothetical protein